jgi:hypothetical protein
VSTPFDGSCAGFSDKREECGSFHITVWSRKHFSLASRNPHAPGVVSSTVVTESQSTPFFSNRRHKTVDMRSMPKEYGRMRSMLILIVVAAGCSTKPNPKSCLDNHCSDPSLPFCDVDGSIGGEPNTCIAVDCMPTQFEECRGNSALTCNAAGNNYELLECEFGCGDTGCKPCDRPECEKHIIPRYVPNACSALATLPSLDITSSMTIDTTNVLSCTSVVTQASGPEICVLHYNTISLAANQTLTVVGTRAIALVADRSFALDGILDVSANSIVNGPGGGLIKSGSGAQNAGGGGAGSHDSGGAGGTNTVTGGAANGGGMSTHPSLITQLLGGTQATMTTNMNPGGGGGAATLISCRGTLSVSGLIDAGGGGGSAATFSAQSGYRFAAGGGSGGTVVLQGLAVSITGQIYANGGGGGSGSAPGGQMGQDAERTTNRAIGGPALVAGDGAGGAGGALSPPGAGQLSPNGLPGAGGGSAGFILTYTPQFVFPTGTPVALSPKLEANGTVATN